MIALFAAADADLDFKNLQSVLSQVACIWIYATFQSGWCHRTVSCGDTARFPRMQTAPMLTPKHGQCSAPCNQGTTMRCGRKEGRAYVFVCQQ